MTCLYNYDPCCVCSSVLDNKLLLVGGENSVGDLLTQVQEYDPSTQAWGTFCALPAAMKSKLWFGGEERGETSTIQHYTCDSLERHFTCLETHICKILTCFFDSDC